MAVYQFYAIIEKNEEENCYIVSFPDLENCFTDGETLVEAVEMAEDVLLAVLSCMEDAGDYIPPASSVEKLKELLPSGASLVNIVIDTDKLRKAD
jgi:antitoxin HicB